MGGDVLEFNPEIYRAEENLRRQLDWVEKIQMRAQILLTAHIAVLAIIVSAVVTTRETVEISAAFIFLLGQDSIIIRIGVLGCGVLIAVLAIWPILKIGAVLRARLSAGKDQPERLLYFNDIAVIDRDEFVKRWRALTDQSYVEDVIFQTWANAQIASKKVKKLRGAQRTSIFSWIMLSCGALALSGFALFGGV